MKKTISIFMCLLLLFSVATIANAVSAESATISIGEVECFANGDVVDGKRQATWVAGDAISINGTKFKNN